MKSKRALAKAPAQPSSIVLYEAADGKVTVKVVFARETFWLTQKTMAELFGVNVPAVNKHLKNIFETGELIEGSVVSILETTAADGKNYPTQFYNLDAVIAVGFRRPIHSTLWSLLNNPDKLEITNRRVNAPALQPIDQPVLL